MPTANRSPLIELRTCQTEFANNQVRTLRRYAITFDTFINVPGIVDLLSLDRSGKLRAVTGLLLRLGDDFGPGGCVLITPPPPSTDESRMGLNFTITTK